MSKIISQSKLLEAFLSLVVSIVPFCFYFFTIQLPLHILRQFEFFFTISFFIFSLIWYFYFLIKSIKSNSKIHGYAKFLITPLIIFTLCIVLYSSLTAIATIFLSNYHKTYYAICSEHHIVKDNRGFAPDYDYYDYVDGQYLPINKQSLKNCEV